MQNKKKIIIIISILVCVFSVVVLLFVSPFSSKRYDIESIESQCIQYYENVGLRVMDFIDMTTLFGTNFDELSDATFMSNININEEFNDNSMMIVVINNENSSYYYDLFKSHVDSYLMYSEDVKLTKLYENSILVKGNDYMYFIVGNDAKTIEKEINVFYK